MPFRASDHDPVLVGLNLFKTIIGTARRDEIVGSPGDDVIIGGVGGDTLTGGGGVNVFVYTSMRDAGDTITDFVPGTDFLDLRSVLAEVGYAGADPVADGVVTFFASPHGATIRINHRPLLTLSGVAPDSLRPSRDLIVR